MKVIGFLFIFFSFSLTGIFFKNAKKTFVLQAEGIYSLLSYLKNGITSSRLTIPTLLERFNQSGISVMDEFFDTLTCKNCYISVEKRFERCAGLLDEELGRVCLELGSNIGKCSFDEEVARLTRLEAEVCKLLERRRASFEKTKGAYLSVFPMIGIIVSILLL